MSATDTHNEKEEQKFCCTFAVHSSVRYKAAMTLNYKGTLFHYKPGSKPSDSDNLICSMNGQSYADLYKKAYELFSAISFAEQLKVLLGGGIMDVPMVASIKEMNIGQTEQRLIPIVELRPFLRSIALIETAEQEALLRLFRHAYSNNDPYTQLLFYWHTLVYPDLEEDKAVQFINDNFSKIEPDLPSFRKEATERQFANSDKIVDFGTYIKTGARHSVAHIVRKWKDYDSLEMDNLKQIWHVQYLVEILERLARLKLIITCGIRIGHDPKILEFL